MTLQNAKRTLQSTKHVIDNEKQLRQNLISKLASKIFCSAATLLLLHRNLKTTIKWKTSGKIYILNALMYNVS